MAPSKEQYDKIFVELVDSFRLSAAKAGIRLISRMLVEIAENGMTAENEHGLIEAYKIARDLLQAVEDSEVKE